FTQKSMGGVVPNTIEFDQSDKDAQEKINNFSAELTVLMKDNSLDKALKKIIEFSAHFNQYFQKKEPWKGGAGSNNCILISVNAVRSLAISLYPFLPESSQKMWEQVGMEGSVSGQSWSSMSEITIKEGHKIGISSPLFKKIEAADIEVNKAKLGK
ncbi:MAG: class I tRNA ligase family protein, partial [Nitrosotalea sp.]